MLKTINPCNSCLNVSLCKSVNPELDLITAVFYFLPGFMGLCENFRNRPTFEEMTGWKGCKTN